MRKWLFLILPLFLWGCAQVSSIEGGPKDTTPPRIIKKGGMTPPNATLHFNSSEIRLKFDEFVKLNNPTQTIIVVPDNLKVDATVEGKQLLLKLKGSPSPNTTYVITMNGAVKDFSEANDSLMQYVFSTGSYIDSLNYIGYVVDAFDAKPIQNCFVGLYEPSDSAVYKRPLYFASTDANGKFAFNHLKAGKFAIYAFVDANKDSKWEKIEPMAFLDSTISIDTAQRDTLKMRLFSQPLKAKLSLNYDYPARFRLASKNPFEVIHLAQNGKELPLSTIHTYAPDSLSFMGNLEDTNQFHVAVTYRDFEDSLCTDTLKVRVPLKRRRTPKPLIETWTDAKNYKATDSIVFSFSDYLTGIDTSKIQLLVKKDSVRAPFNYAIHQQVLTLYFKDLPGERFKLNVANKALQFKNYFDDYAFDRDYGIIDTTAFGTLYLSFPKLPEKAVIEMYYQDKLYRTIHKSKVGNSITIKELNPGDYRFKAYLDADDNCRWTTGDFLKGRQPEKVIFFQNDVHIRSNWDIEAELGGK